MLFRDSRDSRFVLRQFPDRFVSFSNMATRKRRDGRAPEEKEAGVPLSEQKSIFIITGHLMTEVYFLGP